jgi:hypothetical protein
LVRADTTISGFSAKLQLIKLISRRSGGHNSNATPAQSPGRYLQALEHHYKCMSKIIFIISLSLLNLLTFAQNQNPKKQISTMHLAGKYVYGSSAEKERVGLAYIFAESDSTILFYLDLNAGPPSLSMGSLIGKVKIKKEKGLFLSSNVGAEDSCKFSLEFKNNKLLINTVNSQYNCGFGHRVIADGVFKRKTNKNPLYFINQEGNKEYFKNLNL